MLNLFQHDKRKPGFLPLARNDIEGAFNYPNPNACAGMISVLKAFKFIIFLLFSFC
ncbi:hypothetical protein [Rickettsia endosymbiont of Orchestes rusci]|uniref:hypothetical protein n=1 Tax=Rickettsia endosymbiont of Orchestes rusci TaxID=3066250 RepID=UPI00313C3653